MKRIKIKQFKYIIYLCLVFVISQCFSCKSELKKIDIDDVEKHRAYQDTVLNQAADLNLKFSVLKDLISQYRLLESEIKSQNSNYYYYMARLYSMVNDFPTRGFWIDTNNNNLKYSDDYTNFYDSSLYFAEQSIKINSNNIRSMFILCNSFNTDYVRFKESNKKLPFSYNRNPNTWNNRVNFIVNNALNYTKIDTTSDKYLSRGICEVALSLQLKDQSFENGYNFSSNNSDKINKLFTAGLLWDYVKGGQPVFLQINEDYFKKEIYPNVELAKIEINRKEQMQKIAFLNPILGKTLYRKGYMATQHSYPGDIRSTSNGPVKYSPKYDNSELIVTLNSDFTCEMVFKPIGYREIVTKKTNWSLANNGEILLANDIFVKIQVTNADFPISEDPFYDYILIKKNIKIDNNELIIEERSTSRSHFFVQYLIAEQRGEAKNDLQYALKLLNELSFDYEMVTSYFYYYGN
jgi:hypothetical protein